MHSSTDALADLLPVVGGSKTLPKIGPPMAARNRLSAIRQPDFSTPEHHRRQLVASRQVPDLWHWCTRHP
jgi:hypothetical protein